MPIKVYNIHAGMQYNKELNMNLQLPGSTRSKLLLGAQAQKCSVSVASEEHFPCVLRGIVLVKVVKFWH
jgi:hypothetical protein